MRGEADEVEFWGERGLRVWCPGFDRGVQLELREETVTIRRRDSPLVSLDWAWCAASGTPQVDDEWSIAERTARRGRSVVPCGLDVVVRRPRRVRAWSGHSGGAFETLRARVAAVQRLPLAPPTARLRDVRDTLQALLRLLARDEEVRRRLRDPQVTMALAADLTAGCVPLPEHRSAVGRDAVDLSMAANMVGLVHPLGRPVSDAGLVDFDAAIDMVRRALEANPYRRDRHIDESDVSAWLRSVYFVDPWPFRALTE